MSAKKALFQFLLHQGGISGLVSQRIYAAGEQPARVVYPYITYFRLANDHQRHLGGGSGLTSARYQVDVWARKEYDADRISEAIREAFDCYKGDMGSSVETINVLGMFLENDSELIEFPDDASERPIFNTSMDLVIWHAESVTPM